MIPTFSTVGALEAAFTESIDGQLILETAILHDLDLVQAWCRSGETLEMDCESLLSAWNLFGDIARSVGERGIPYAESDVNLDSEYEKLFFGSNLPAITPAGKHYEPAWNDGELKAIRRHMVLGLGLFEASVYKCDDGARMAR